MTKHNRTEIAMRNLGALQKFAQDYLPKFERRIDIRLRQKSVLRAFEDLGMTKRQPYKAYAACKPVERCDVEGCPSCDAVKRVAATRVAESEISSAIAKGAREFTFTGILKEMNLTAAELKKLEWSKICDRVRKSYIRNVGDKYETYAWMSADVDCKKYKSMKDEVYTLHLHGVICVWGYADASHAEWAKVKGDIRKRLRESIFPKLKKNMKPIQTKDPYDLPNWLTYCLKTAFSIRGKFGLPSRKRAVLDVPIRVFLSNMGRRRYLEIRTKGKRP